MRLAILTATACALASPALARDCTIRTFCSDGTCQSADDMPAVITATQDGYDVTVAGEALAMVPAPGVATATLHLQSTDVDGEMTILTLSPRGQLALTVHRVMQNEHLAVMQAIGHCDPGP